jgi:predicted HTH transcriptional regulator
MLDKPFDAIQKSDVDFLIENQIIEHKQLDYKRDLPGGRDSEKIEFLADVSSFANASGGHIIYGLGEKKDEAGKNTGIPEYVGLEGVNIDEHKLRLEQMILSGTEPRIPGIQVKPITGFNNAPVIIMRIPKSWAGPHMVTFQNCSRFYSPNSGDTI